MKNIKFYKKQKDFKMNINKEDIKNLNEKIKEYDNIYILRHQRPDFDAIGSQVALEKILKKAYPNKKIYAAGNDDISIFSYLGNNEKILENKIKDSLILIVDTANVDRIEGEKYSVLKKNNNYIVKIDHHPNIEKYGDINIVDDKISSTSELCYIIFIENLKYELDENSSRALYAGIYGDTGGFSFSKTTSKTFSVASELVKYGFNFEDLMLNLKELDEKTVRALGWFYQNINIEDGLGILKLDKKKLKELNFDTKNLSLLVNFLGVFNNIKAWVLMIEHDNFIRVNMRSKKDIDVSLIANKFNGGGHKNASGAKIYKWEEADEVLNLLKEEIKNKS